MGSNWYSKMGLRRHIPGTTGRKIPGNPTMPHFNGGFRTNVGFQANSSLFRERHRQQIRDRGQFSGGWGYAWQGLALSADQLNAHFDKLDDNIERAAQKLADDMLAYAKENAPWLDHPGVHEDARDNLQVAVVKNRGDHSFSIYLGHGKNVYYGIWLEVRWGGKYAILLPTLYKFAPELGTNIKTMT